MRYLSLFSGVEAASCAWEPLGWTPVAFAEIESFPSNVLKHRFPHVPNLGDVTKLTELDMKVRRLTPRECERLQGFSDDWTNIPAKVRVLLPEDSGPCAKRRVTATVVDTSGTHWVAFNHTMKPQTRCPRAGMSTGVGYELCRDVCQQPGHAEINAIKFAGDKARGATLYVSGHSYVCDDCMSAARKGGVSKVVVGHPPGDAKDGPRYKALGNSMAVPVINWIGRSIEMAEMGFWKA